MPKKPTVKGRKPVRTSIKDKDLMKAQATLVVAKRIQGQSIQQIAQELNVHEDTVARRIDYAKRHNLLAQATDRVLGELVDLAHAAYRQALVEGDVSAARDILFGTGILSKNNKAQVAPASETAELTLAVWREQRKKGYEAATTADDAEGIVLTTTRRDAAQIGEVLGADDGSDVLSPARPANWPPPPPDDEDLEDSEDD
jgi:hypothetical protein